MGLEAPFLWTRIPFSRTRTYRYTGGMNILLAAALFFGLPAAAFASGITYYSNGTQQYLSFEEITTLESRVLAAKLQDISLHTDWIKSYADPPFNNPELYPAIVKETIEQGRAVKQALQDRKLDLQSCAGMELSAMAACMAAGMRGNADLDARIKLVEEFTASFEKL